MRTVRARTVQDGHTVWEQAIYESLWREASPSDVPEQKVIAIGYRHIAALTRLGLKTIQRNMKSLEQKLTLAPIGRYNSDTKAPKTYRLYSYKAILERRKEAGLEWVSVNRQGVELVRDPSLTTVLKVTTAPTVGTGTVPTVPTGDGPHGDYSFSTKEQEQEQEQEERTSSSDLCQVVATAIRGHLPIDDDGINQLVAGCLQADPAATAEEIIHFAELKIGQHRNMRSVRNPIGLLIRSVPQCFTGKLIMEYRAALHRRAEAAREQAQKILNDPDATPDERDLAREIVSGLNQTVRGQ